ncbi:hypothetical protein BH11ACT8_BH11ACT8_29140 [soil metagenome]
MEFVKHIPAGERHVAVLLGGLMQEIRAVFAAEDWQGLRQSHLRVIATVPADGISVTELGERLGMTKQGCGQFVTHLVGTGHLEAAVHPDDGRVRVVRRTAIGEQNVRDVTERMARIEDDWRALVGERRYADFRAVAEEIVLHDDSLAG